MKDNNNNMSISSSAELALKNAQARLKNVGIELFDYQVDGVKWMLERELNPDGTYYTGGLLCDDPGLGKTLQAISLMLANPVDKTLIVVPISLMEQWRDQIRKVWPEAKMRLCHGPNGSFNSYEEINGHFDVVISGYTKMFDVDANVKDYRRTIMHSVEWGRIILDECHTIRNKNSKTFKGCFDLRAKFRWGLSGTPLQNRVDDLVSLFRFIHVPEAIIKSNLEVLKDNYVKRRNKSLVADKYKGLNIKIVDIPFTDDKEREFYTKVKDEVKREYLRIMNEEDTSGAMMELFELLLRLRQATIHPNLVIKGLAKKFKVLKPNLWKGSSTKITKIIELFSSHTTEDKSLIICHYQEEMDLLKHYISRAFPDLRIEIFNGQMDLTNRNACVRRCTCGEVDVLLIQIMAGGVGLNLQVFNKVYMMTPNWNPGNEIQAIARCHRIGQTRNVEVYKLIIKEDDFPTIDEKIISIQVDKRDLMVHYLGDTSLEFNEYFSSQTPMKQGLNMKDMRKLLLT